MILRSSFLPPEGESGLAQSHSELRFHFPLKGSWHRRIGCSLLGC
jgi:hypothetical protein